MIHYTFCFLAASTSRFFLAYSFESEILSIDVAKTVNYCIRFSTFLKIQFVLLRLFLSSIHKHISLSCSHLIVFILRHLNQSWRYYINRLAKICNEFNLHWSKFVQCICVLRENIQIALFFLLNNVYEHDFRTVCLCFIFPTCRVCNFSVCREYFSCTLFSSFEIAIRVGILMCIVSGGSRLSLCSLRLSRRNA